MAFATATAGSCLQCASLRPSRGLARHHSSAPVCRRAVRPVQALFGGKDGDGKSKNPFQQLGDMGEMVKRVASAQKLVAAQVQELANTDFEGFSDDETVKVVMSGNQEPREVDITEAAMSEGVEKLNQRVLEATKDAHSKSVEGMRKRMSTLYEELGMPTPPQFSG